MKLQVERDPLAEAVAWAARALPARPTAPVLAGVRIQAGSELTLSTFDYEVSARAIIAAPADEPGTVLVSGRLLAEIVRSLPAKPVDLSTDGSKMTIRCGSTTFTLQLLPADEYPTLPEMPDVTGTVGADTFSSSISQVAIAAGRDDTLPALTGIRVEIVDDRLTLVATDRYRLAVRELRWNPITPSLNTAVLVPAKVLSDTAKALTSGAEVAIALAAEAASGASSDGIIGFEGAGRRTTTRLLSGEYPKYQALLPSEFSAAAELPAGQFADAVKRVALVAERNTPVRLTFNPGEVLLEAGTGDDAQATEAIEATFEGESMQIAFNHQYLLDGIGAIDSDVARISFTSATRPAVITGKGESQPDYRYVLMPIRNAGLSGGHTPAPQAPRPLGLGTVTSGCAPRGPSRFASGTPRASHRSGHLSPQPRGARCAARRPLAVGGFPPHPGALLLGRCAARESSAVAGTFHRSHALWPIMECASHPAGAD